MAWVLNNAIKVIWGTISYSHDPSSEEICQNIEKEVTAMKMSERSKFALETAIVRFSVHSTF